MNVETNLRRGEEGSEEGGELQRLGVNDICLLVPILIIVYRADCGPQVGPRVEELAQIGLTRGLVWSVGEGQVK